MRRYTIQRKVIETIEVDADTADEAERAADESPIDLWTRDIKSEAIVFSTPRYHLMAQHEEGAHDGNESTYAAQGCPVCIDSAAGEPVLG